MQMFTAVRTWLTNLVNRHERGQTATEYVLIILAVVLKSAVTAISSWIAGNGPPP